MLPLLGSRFAFLSLRRYLPTQTVHQSILACHFGGDRRLLQELTHNEMDNHKQDKKQHGFKGKRGTYAVCTNDRLVDLVGLM